MKTNKNIPDTSRSVHLSASAGSGKTKALTDRYLALLELLDRRDLGIDQAVAITFTEKAAAEIRQRVMRDLPEPMLRKIIRGRQDLRISTIHSFCMNLLKRYPLEAGLPPDFGVLDDRDRITRIRAAVEDALESSGSDAALMRPLREHSVDRLTALIGSVFSLRSRLKRIEIDAGGQEELLRAFRSGMGVERASAELRELLSGRAWRTTISAMESLLRQLSEEYGRSGGKEHLLLAEARDSDTALPLVSSLERIYFTAEGSPRKKPFLPKNACRGRTRPGYEAAYFAVQEQLVRYHELAGRASAGQEALSLLALFLQADRHYDAAKLREGLLDFDDLEIAAYRLLRGTEWPEILYRLDRKVLHFLVDEFQDTSDIQWALLSTLTSEIFAGEGADKPMPPTLFVVGDEKQSIYRFREANYRLIGNVRKKMLDSLLPEARDIRTLGRNFRSTPAVIDAVNSVFSALWGERYAPSETDRAGHEGSVRLLEVPPAGTEDEGNGVTEAGVLAREIRGMVERGTIVYEKMGVSGSSGDRWRARPAGYDDCAILVQSRTKLKEYESSLQREDVPFRVVGGFGFYDEDEVQAVIAVLSFLWNRDDRFSLAAALRSGLFGLSDQDIFEVFTGEDPLAVLQNIRPDAADLLRSWTALSGVAPLADLIRRIVIDAGAYIRFGRKNHQAIFNLDKLIDTARDFDGRGFTTLQDFVEWVKDIRESDLREAAADMNLPGFKGAVSIMTVHKAKGLEFPVLFLPGMNQKTRSAIDGPRVLVESDGQLRMAVRNGGNAAYQEMWEREREELLREHQRLLYVAMTRARDHLVMIGTLQSGKKPVQENTWLSYLERSLPARSADGSAVAAVRCRSHPSWEPKEHALAISRGPASAADPLKKVSMIDPALVLRNLGPVTAPAPLEWKKATDLVNEEREFSPAVPFVPEPGAVPPMVRGSLLHRCLEDLSLTGSFDLDARAMEFDEVLSLDEAARGQFLSGARSVLASVAGNKELSWIFEQRTGSYSELPFLSRKGNSLISGVIDRLVVKDKKGYVIDYKAIRTENDEAARTWTGHYRPQVHIYCEAVKEIFRLASVEGYLLLLDSGRLEKVLEI